MIRTNNHRGYKAYSPSGSHNDELLNLCEEVKMHAQDMGFEDAKALLKDAECKGKITHSEKEFFYSLLKTRNLSAHGMAGYISVSPEALKKAEQIMRKVKGEVNRSFSKSVERRSIIDSEGYYFDFYVKETRSSGFIINIIKAPYWRFMMNHPKSFNVFTTEKGTTVYTNHRINTPDEAVRVINNFVSTYASVLDEGKC
ncbi:MAG: hypothetical protein K5786_05800 [Treponema sp.]|nr:hypothetical protein [Treponema sp.]